MPDYPGFPDISIGGPRPGFDPSGPIPYQAYVDWMTWLDARDAAFIESQNAATQSAAASEKGRSRFAAGGVSVLTGTPLSVLKSSVEEGNKKMRTLLTGSGWNEAKIDEWMKKAWTSSKKRSGSSLLPGSTK